MKITNECNMELMKRYPDNHFELAIVDPPYGIGKKFKGGKSGKMNFNEVVRKGWDNETPSAEYFDELKRVSKNQIIWGLSGGCHDNPLTTLMESHFSNSQSKSDVAPNINVFHPASWRGTPPNTLPNSPAVGARILTGVGLQDMGVPSQTPHG